MKVPYAYGSSMDRVSKGFRDALIERREDVFRVCRDLPAGWGKYDVEIGCGHGHFLAAYAEAHPERYCIGIDIAGGRLERARRKSERAGLKNIAWIRAEALLFLECLPETISFSRVFILFPDPWPKKRHHKHRLVQTGFMDFLSSVCRPGATLYFRTDNSDYAKHAGDAIAGSGAWEERPTEVWPWERASVFQELAEEYQSLVARKCAPQGRAEVCVRPGSQIPQSRRRQGPF